MKKSQPKRPKAPGSWKLADEPHTRTRIGELMLKGDQWTLISPYKLEFTATLLETINEGDVRVAIFSVPKR